MSASSQCRRSLPLISSHPCRCLREPDGRFCTTFLHFDTPLYSQQCKPTFAYSHFDQDRELSSQEKPKVQLESLSYHDQAATVVDLRQNLSLSSPFSPGVITSVGMLTR